MKTLILMGRGIEGTGNTRCVIDFQDYVSSIEGNDNVKVIANSEKKWPRQNSQKNNIELYSFENMFDDGHKYDYVFVYSVPAKNFTDTNKENFMRTIENHKSLGSKIIYVQLDHKIQSINRNFYASEKYLTRFFDLIDVVITHCKDNDFCQKFLKRKYSREIPVKEVVAVGVDFDSIPKRPFSEKRDKSIHFIGRSAVWKGWLNLIDLHSQYLKSEGYVTIIEGIELSIGILTNMFTETKPNRIPKSNQRHMYGEDVNQHLEDRDSNAMIFGPFVRDEALNRVTTSKFAAFFTYLGKQYGGVFENAFLEDVATKTVVIIRKELYDTAKLNLTSDLLNVHKPEDIGIVVYDKNNPQELVKTLNELNSNEELYNSYVEKAYDFFKNQFDKRVVGKAIFDGVKES